MVEDRIEAFALSDGQGPPRGARNVTCSIAFGERVIAPLIRHFVKQCPQVIATLDLNNRVVDLVSENYDVAIRTGHLSDSRLIGRRIGSRKLYLCATPDYLEKHGVPSDINDRSEEHTSELQSLMRISYAVFCLKKKKTIKPHSHIDRCQ